MSPQFPRAHDFSLTLLVVVYFLYLVWPATHDYLNPDDTMNLYVAWTTPVAALLKGTFAFWTGAIRPVGSLYYRLIYALGGFHPLPFRLTCFLLLILNLVLAFQFYRLLTALRDAFLAAFIGCFHGAMWTIYSSTGTIYDILCQTFVLTAVILYVAGRRQGGISLLRVILIWLCTILAIGSKEMAYTLPLVFVCYELTFHPPEALGAIGPWVRQQFPAVGVTALFSVAAWLGRKAAKNGVDQLYGYKPLLTSENILHALRQYLYLLSFKTMIFTSAQAVLLLTMALLLALLLRSHVMLFGWLYTTVFAIPLLIVPPRHSGYVLYVPSTGLALYAAGAIRFGTIFLERVTLNLAWRSPWARAARNIMLSLVLLATILLHFLQRHLVVARDFAPGGEDQVRVLSEDVLRLYPRLPTNTRLLLINDAFGDERWQPMFVIHLTYGDRSLKITKMRQERTGVLRILPGAYDHVLVYDGGHYRKARTN